MSDKNDKEDHKPQHPGYDKLSAGEKAAWKLTNFCGSWAFIIILFIYMFIWIGLNVYAILTHWDPYPFILLNLTLSCLAAIQAPIILMGQNLLGERDRRRAEYDYAVNRKAMREVEETKKQLARIHRLIKLHEEQSEKRHRRR